MYVVFVDEDQDDISEITYDAFKYLCQQCNNQYKDNKDDFELNGNCKVLYIFAFKIRLKW